MRNLHLQVADTLSHCPSVPGEIDSDCERKEYETIWYITVCDDIHDVQD